MTQPNIADATVGAFADAYRTSLAAHTPSDPPDQTTTAIRAGLAAAAPHIAAAALRSVSEQIASRARQLRDEFRFVPVSIDYINGMEDADSWVERAIAHHELSAETTAR